MSTTRKLTSDPIIKELSSKDQPKELSCEPLKLIVPYKLSTDVPYPLDSSKQLLKQTLMQQANKAPIQDYLPRSNLPIIQKQALGDSFFTPLKDPSALQSSEKKDFQNLGLIENDFLLNSTPEIIYMCLIKALKFLQVADTDKCHAYMSYLDFKKIITIIDPKIKLQLLLSKTYEYRDTQDNKSCWPAFFSGNKVNKRTKTDDVIEAVLAINSLSDGAVYFYEDIRRIIGKDFDKQESTIEVSQQFK